MPDFSKILNNSQAEKMLKNSDKLEELMAASETQKLFSMLNQNAGGNLEKITENAANGNNTELMTAIKQLLQNPDAVKLIDQMKQKLK